MPNDNSLELLSEVLDKLIETQIQTAHSMADLTNAIRDNNQDLKKVHELLTAVNAHFSNGFRSEIKNHIDIVAKRALESIEHEITTRAEEGKQESKAILKTLKEFIIALKSPKAWLSAFALIASVVGTIAAIIVVVLKVMGA